MLVVETIAARAAAELCRFSNGTARHLLDLLEAALGRTEIAAGEAEVGVDNSNQSQVREMIALRDQLCADDNIDGAGFHCSNEFRCPKWRPDGVGRDDRGARIGKQFRHFIGDPLDVMSRAVQVFVGGVAVYEYRDGVGVTKSPYRAG